MIDFSKFTLPELRAIGAVMDDLMQESVNMESWKFAAYVRSTAREAFRAESAAIYQQAAELTVYAIPRKPIKLDPQSLKKFEELYNEYAGDALDDLCAAGEVLGADE